MQLLLLIIYNSNKSKFAAAMISNCKSHTPRGSLIRLLRQYVDIDVYGKCGNHKCPSGGQPDDCRAHIAGQYKFFLALENSLCKEYVTEKFFRTLNFNIVPVVLGLGDYSKYVPASGFINVLDFRTPHKLAQHLIRVASDPQSYNEYFAWRRHISYHRERWTSRHLPPAAHTTTFHMFCEMCVKLNMETHNGVRERRIFNLEKLYEPVVNCKHLTMAKMLKDKFVIGSYLPQKPWCQQAKHLRRFFVNLNIKNSNSTC